MEGLKTIIAPHLLNVINTHPELTGCQIYYRSEETGEIMISPGNPTSKNAKIIVTLEKNSSRTNRGFLKKELTSVFVNCSLTVLSASGVAGGVAASGFTGGAAIGVSIIAWSGFIASGLKCSNSIGRSMNSIFDPDSNSLYELDSDVNYKKLMENIDLAGEYIGYLQLTASFVKLGTKYRMISDAKLFANLPRDAKKKAIKDLLTKMSKTAEGKKDLEKFYKDLGIDFGKKIQGLSYQQVKDISSKISIQLNRTNFIKDLDKFINKQIAKKIIKSAKEDDKIVKEIIKSAKEDGKIDEINNFTIHIISP